MKKSKDITLIALVITIIVLLILAGVTIASLSGDNGILTRAADAKEKTRREDIQEQLNLWKTEKTMEENIGGNNMNISDFVAKLRDNKTITQKEFEEIESTHQLVIGKQEPIIFPYDKPKGKTLVEAFDAGELKVGDYLDYNEYVSKTNGSKVANLSTAETGYGSEQSFAFSNTTKWRILGKEGDHLKLISGSPIKNGDAEQYLHLVGAEGWYHTNDELVGKENNILNRMCRELYSSDLAQEVRSVNIDDINSALGYTLQGNGMLDSGNNPVTSFDGTIGYERKYNTGEFSPYNFLKDKYPDQYNDLSKKTSSNSEIGTGYFYDIPQEQNVLNEMLFNGTTDLHNSYWLASSGVGADSNVCVFGPGFVDGGSVGSYDGLFGSNGDANASWLGVRPVVSLRSDITINDLHKVDITTEKTWTNTAGYEDVSTEYFKDGHGKIEK